MSYQLDYKQLDKINIDDEYDLNAFVGKMMQNYNISIDLKDKIKHVIREAYMMGKQSKGK